MHVDPAPTEARLGARNELTLPDSVVQAFGLIEGDRLIVDVDPADPEVIRVSGVRGTYAGALGAVYGKATEALAEERGTWPARP